MVLVLLLVAKTSNACLILAREDTVNIVHPLAFETVYWAFLFKNKTHVTVLHIYVEHYITIVCVHT